MSNKTNIQRDKNFWEPIYAPENDNSFRKWTVNDDELNTTSGKKNVWIDIADFIKLKKNIIENFTFTDIDFEGIVFKERLKFLKCKFISCSFRNSEWDSVKFTDCEFTRTSFSISKFTNCEFRKCKYKEIGISGNETKFDNVYIEPKKFINAAYTNTDEKVLFELKINPLYQIYRLENTKTAVARMLLQMKPIRNDIDTYATAKKIARTSEIFYYIKKNLYEIKINRFFCKINPLLKLMTNYIEFLFTYSIGWLSGWGLKVGRTLSIGFIVTLFFGAYYYFFTFKDNELIDCYLRSLEYWFLVGYTKYDFENVSIINQYIIFMNSLLGMFWFGTLLPVILEKLGKSDE